MRLAIDMFWDLVELPDSLYEPSDGGKTEGAVIVVLKQTRGRSMQTEEALPEGERESQPLVYM